MITNLLLSIHVFSHQAQTREDTEQVIFYPRSSFLALQITMMLCWDRNLEGKGKKGQATD